MDQVLLLVQQLQSPEAQFRKNAENQLSLMGQNDPDGLVKNLTDLAMETSLNTADRQMSLSSLKLATFRHWNIGFTNFIGPAVGQDSKDKVRTNLMILIGNEERKVRTSAAQLLAKIASVEFPEEWPGLIDQILHMMENGSTIQLQGALNVLNEVLYDALSVEEFPIVAKSILPELYKIAASSNGEYSLILQTSAVECFKRCMMFYEQMSKITNEDAQLANNMISQWFELFCRIMVHKVDDPGRLCILKLKREILTTINEIKEGLYDTIVLHVSKLVDAVWADLKQSYQLYEYYYIQNNNNESINPASIEDAEVTDSSLGVLVSQEFAFAIEYINYYNMNPSFEQEMASLVPYYAQLSKSTIDEDDDISYFVSEETDLAMDDKIRYEIAQAVCDYPSPIIFNSLSRCLVENEDNWILQESCLYLWSQLLSAEQVLESNDISQQLLNELSKYAYQGIQSNQPRLQARCLLLTSALVKDTKLDENLKKQLWEIVFSNGYQNSNNLVRVASLFTVKAFSEQLKPHIQPHQEVIFNAINSLVPVADEDTPAFLVEILQYAIRLDYNIAARSSSVMHLLFTLAAKDTANVELTSETSDVFEDIVEYARENGCYVQVCQNAMPTLLNGLNQMKDWEYNADIVLALGLICELLRQGPTPLPNEVLEAIVDPLYKIIVNTTDVELSQAASEAFTHLVEHAADQLKNWKNENGVSGPELILQVASKLLDPQADDSATLNSGKLILAIFTRFGSDLGDVSKQLLEAVALRLRTAKNLVLVQNLLSVFCELVLKSAIELVDILSQIQVDDHQQSALQVVLDKWLGSFDVLRGYEEIKKNVIALQRLYELNDERIKNVQVDGDQENPESGIILTRSKAKNLKVIKIPANVKIIKLLANEMSTTPMEDNEIKDAVGFGDKNGNDDHNDDDDEWEDMAPVSSQSQGQIDDNLKSLYEQFAASEEDNTDLEKRQVDSETYWLIVNWFKSVAEAEFDNFRYIYQNYLNENERIIVNDHIRM